MQNKKVMFLLLTFIAVLISAITKKRGLHITGPILLHRRNTYIKI